VESDKKIGPPPIPQSHFDFYNKGILRETAVSNQKAEKFLVMIKRRLIMSKKFVLDLEDNSVRFTPSGEIAVIDAIKLLSDSDTAEEIWNTLKDENPEILAHCKRFYFSKNKTAVVADSRGWEQIEFLLFDYILDDRLLRQPSEN
jgi:hypothetical protein